MKVHAAITASCAARNTVPATMIPATLMQNPPVVASLMKIALLSFVLVVMLDFRVADRSKPNLSVMWMDCTSSMSSRALDPPA